MAAAVCATPPPRGADIFFMAVDPLPPTAFRFAEADAERTDFVEVLVAWLLVSRQDCLDAGVAFAAILAVARAPRGAIWRTVENAIYCDVILEYRAEKVGVVLVCKEDGMVHESRTVRTARTAHTSG